MLSANARKSVYNCQAQSTANREGARNSTEDTVYLGSEVLQGTVTDHPQE